jgi:hypothetical protein
VERITRTFFCLFGAERRDLRTTARLSLRPIQVQGTCPKTQASVKFATLDAESGDLFQHGRKRRKSVVSSSLQ